MKSTPKERATAFVNQFKLLIQPPSMIETVTECVAKLISEERAGGLDKAVEIARYWRDMPMRNAASQAACKDIETSCAATALRIRRGEYENPTSSVGEDMYASSP